MIVLSIVTPCYNEEAGITECYEAVRAVMEAELPEYRYEHIFIDNCSEDRTVALLRAIAATDKRVKIIVNSRNFGPERSPFPRDIAIERRCDNPNSGGPSDAARLDSEHGQALAGRRQGRHRR